MSIASDLTRLATAKQTIKTAIEGKGVTVEASKKLDEYGALIDAIPTGGEYEVSKDWPDIRTILSNHDESRSYKNRMIILFDRYPDGVNINGAEKYWFSNGETATSYGYYTIPCDSNGFRWCIFASNSPLNTNFRRTPSQGSWDYASDSKTQANPVWVYSDNEKTEFGEKALHFIGGRSSIDILDINICFDGSNTPASGLVNGSGVSYIRGIEANVLGMQLFSGCTRLRNVHSLKCNSCYGNYMFNECRSLHFIPIEYISLTGEVTAMFMNCTSLRSLPKFIHIIEPSSNCNLIFGYDANLVCMPKILDLSGLTSTNVNNMFTEKNKARNFPELIVPNLTSTSSLVYDFSKLEMVDADTVAKFDASNNIIGGFAKFAQSPNTYTLSDGTVVANPSAGKTSSALGASGARTLKLSSVVKSRFTGDQQSAIETAITSQGWAFVW